MAAFLAVGCVVEVHRSFVAFEAEEGEFVGVGDGFRRIVASPSAGKVERLQRGMHCFAEVEGGGRRFPDAGDALEVELERARKIGFRRSRADVVRQALRPRGEPGGEWRIGDAGWEIIDLDAKQHPGDSPRSNFTEVVMLSVLREQLKVINPWLEEDQVDEVVKQLTANFPSTNLLQNNRHVFNQLLESTSVSENRKTGEKSPSVKFIDFKNRDNNRFVAVCQFKIRILGSEHHIIPDIVLFLNGLPVVVIEAKSPKVKEPTQEAIDQLLRYSEQRGSKGEGSAPLFFYNQFVITTCRQEA